MQDLRTVRFISRHTVELQGLRTALVGALCLAAATWCIGSALWHGSAVSTHPVWWMPLILLGWHVDQQLLGYYGARVGHVMPTRPGRRLIVLGSIVATYAMLRLVELQFERAVALSALFLAGVQLHIGMISGERYRRHYLLGAACWAALSLLPLLTLSHGALHVSWLMAAGLTLVFLGWRDHMVLMRALTSAGVSHAENV